MIEYIIYEQNAGSTLILDLLKEYDTYFIPKISERTNLIEYAKKLSSNATIIVVKDDIHYVGFSAFYLNKRPKDSYLSLIAVNHDYQKQGIGNKLIDKIIDYCKNNKSSGIMLEMRANNIELYKFYSKFGFEIAEIFTSPYTNDEKYYIYKKLSDD